MEKHPIPSLKQFSPVHDVALMAILGLKNVAAVWRSLFHATVSIWYVKIQWQQNNENYAVAVAEWMSS